MQQGSNHSHNRELIIVVDDDRVSREIMAGFLEKLGFTTICLEDGHYLTFSCSYFAHVKAIMMDMNMPVLNGYKATKRIRKVCRKNPALDHLPIIAVSGVEFDDHKCIKAGCDALLKKPLTIKRLYDALVDCNVVCNPLELIK